MKTNVPGIYAIGDIVGEPMLAHKATHEGKVAAEVIAGHDVTFDAKTIPSVAYTDPEVAWMGLTETEAKASGIEYEKAIFPWAASGRALALGRDEGLSKLIVEPESQRVLGAGIVGVDAGDLISETVLALEMGANATDIALTVHPHPTLSETVAFSAEMVDGSITDLMPPRGAPASSAARVAGPPAVALSGVTRPQVAHPVSPALAVRAVFTAWRHHARGRAIAARSSAITRSGSLPAACRCSAAPSRAPAPAGCRAACPPRTGRRSRWYSQLSTSTTRLNCGQWKSTTSPISDHVDAGLRQPGGADQLQEQDLEPAARRGRAVAQECQRCAQRTDPTVALCCARSLCRTRS